MRRLYKKAVDTLKTDISQNNSLQEQINPYTDLTKEQKQEAIKEQHNIKIDPKIVSEVMQLLDRIKESSNNLKDIYYALFDNLNALFASYPSIYQQLQMTVKLPTNKDAMNTVIFNNDLLRALNKFQNEAYLASYLQNSSETIE